MKSTEFIQRMFRDYYNRDAFLNCSVSMVEKREFGFLSFEGQMLRHKSFQSADELKYFLKNFVPKDAYFSCAYYENPEAEMERKGWLGADLIFDIDADHIPTTCDKVHDEWQCSSCGFCGKGTTPEKCPICGNEKFDVNTWPCEDCLASAKAETIKIIEILKQDFGFSDNEIHTFFSGHRGYHVHVESDAVKMLDAMARKEIVDYVSALGLNVAEPFFLEKSSKDSVDFQEKIILEFGWPKRLIMGLCTFIAGAQEKDFIKIGIEGRVVGILLHNKNKILQNLQKTGTLGYVKGVGSQTWAKVVSHVMKLKAANIDTVVTTDTHRLIRLNNTLNGKTGLKKVEFPVSTIESFDPFKMAVAFKEGFVDVKVYDAPKFKLGEETFGPYKNQRVELPTAAAVLLICRNRAEVIA